MITRSGWLILILLVRCVLGRLETFKFSVDVPVSVIGYVDIVYRNNSNCIMSIDIFLIDSGKICAAKPGDRIRVFGTLDRRLIESFEGRLWLVSKQIDRLDKTQKTENSKSKYGEGMDYFREGLVSVIKRSMPEPEAGLIAGVVLGYKKDIGQELYEKMIKSGSVHIAVASGYNILLVGGVILSLGFWILKRPQAIGVAVAAMIFYAVLAGGEPPVVRAVWMAGFMYLGQAMGRSSVAYWILLLTAWVMLMIQPSLLASASFQLSVAASFGLMVIEPWLSRWLETRAGAGAGPYKGSGLVDLVERTGIMTSVATMIATMPIIWWHFGRMSLIGIVSNILILPFVPPLMILGVGMLVLPSLFSWPAYALAHWMVMVIRFFGQ